MLYLKGYKRMLFQNQQVRNYFLVTVLDTGQAYQTFFKKMLKWKGASALTIIHKCKVPYEIASL